MSSLFIIGNGFDKAHELPTIYSDFREWLLEEYFQKDERDYNIGYSLPEPALSPDGEIVFDEKDNVHFFIRYFDSIEESEREDFEKWKDFESSLGHFNFDSYIDEFEFLDRDGDEKLWEKDAMISSISEYLPTSVINIKKFFTDWICQIDISEAEQNYNISQLFNQCPRSYFLTTNYTSTLEEIYNIPINKICHIHGTPEEEIIVGHGEKEDNINYYENIDYEESLSEIRESLRKDTVQQYEKHKNFFSDIYSSNINKIYSYGFSFSKVDRYYLVKIFENVSTENITWFFNDYHQKEEPEKLEEYMEVLKEIGFKGDFDLFSV
ncbi:bacteriophage abortive infection AbiH family protein [Lactococcus garvieae]|uniref:Bacteriophage abortive infection AbiH family protein n=1 Tax=Lactococcus garvieae TaxID=1363 RepID=A0AAX3NED2_9LACT|nr:bacteriophage abortive infection AbiH family protein [Lactococcus garvieae]WEA14977.1 bacteriophage abortive infection AbiH family protein [Lactococcus garvieae]